MNNLELDVILHKLLEHSNNIVICLSSDFAITLLSASAEEFYRWDKAACGKNFLDLCKTANYVCPINDKFFANPVALNINVDSNNAVGKKCNINWTVLPLLISDKNPSGAILIGKDIELKKNNIAYYLNGIIAALPGSLYWKDREGRYLGCNAYTAQLAGLASVYDIIGKTDSEVWGAQANLLVENDQQVIQEGKIVPVEESLQVADGSLLHFTGIKMPLRDENNNIIGLIGNSLDITELKNTQSELRKSREEAEALSKIKSEFISNMSHDVKTPLSGIIGLSQLLTDRLNDENLDLAKNILFSSQQLMNFFDNCLAMAKSTTMDVTLIKEEFDLKLLFSQIIELLQPAAQNKDLAFYAYYDKNIPSLLFGSRVGIYRILLNLVGNAIKFTEHGKVSISINLSDRSSATRPIISFTVEDSGIGIPKEKQQIIFERFTRLIPAYKGIYEGIGIGLHLVDKFVKAMQGEINVNSDEGKGSCFIVKIPLEVLSNPENEIIPAHTSAITVSDSKENKKLDNILLVEDNLIAQRIAKIVLTEFCEQLDIAPDGKTALNLFANKKYDLVFMDIGLPDISGLEVTTAFREQEKASSNHVPIVALTAHATDLIQDDCIKLGMDGVLCKPLTKEQAVDIINRLCNIHEFN